MSTGCDRGLIDVGDRIPILLYHSLTVDARPSYRPYAVDPGLFRAQMECIAETGLTTSTVSDLLAWQTADRRMVAITFDDGFRDVIDVALPILQQNGLTATVYIVTGLVGQTSRWLDRDGEGQRPLMSWAEIRNLAEAGVEIGAHSHHHLPLDLLPRSKAADQIARSRRTLEDALGFAVKSFAYPYGFHTMETKQLVAREGFSSACSVRNAFSHRFHDPYALARIIVASGTPMNMFRDWIDGRGSLPTSWPGELFRTRVWRTVRRVRSVVGA